MGKLKILASGDSPQAQAQTRGKLFEKFMAEVLQELGYEIDRIPNINYAGMEIDIEGKSTATRVPLYAECKYYETNIDSPKLQAFFGKYMTRWLKDNKSQGLFIAIPGINPHAKGFYKDYIENDSGITFRVLEEDDVLEVLFKSKIIAQPETIAKNIPTNIGSPGDWFLIYTDKGKFWIQYIISEGKGIPDKIAVFDAMGSPISDRATIDYLIQLYPEIDDFGIITIENTTMLQTPSVHK
ncbi:MAG: restriction endonuclease, partial [Thermotogota bacterium]|nr:restriction endonuclease [Thermotogota bacterium]